MIWVIIDSVILVMAIGVILLAIWYIRYYSDNKSLLQGFDDLELVDPKSFADIRHWEKKHISDNVSIRNAEHLRKAEAKKLSRTNTTPCMGWFIVMLLGYLSIVTIVVASFYLFTYDSTKIAEARISAQQIKANDFIAIRQWERTFRSIAQRERSALEEIEREVWNREK